MARPKTVYSPIIFDNKYYKKLQASKTSEDAWYEAMVYGKSFTHVILDEEVKTTPPPIELPVKVHSIITKNMQGKA
jgi:hypothetical protein